MKAQTLGLFALASLGSAVPHGHRGIQRRHQNLHEARDNAKLVTETDTVVVTVTRPAAVIWVNTDGKPVSTQYNTPAATPSPSATPIVSVPVQPQPAPSAAPPAPAPVPNTPPPAPSTTPPVAAGGDGKNVQPGGFWQGGQGAPAGGASNDANQAGQGSQVSQGNQADQASSANQGQSPASTGAGYGICYDMIYNGPCKDPATIDSDLGMLAGKGYKMVRTYDIGCDVGQLVKAAGNHGMKAFIGINTINNVQGDMQKLINYVNAVNGWQHVDTVNVGNEVVNNGGSPSASIAALNTARGMLQGAGYTGNVVIVDTFNQILANPSLCGDYCAANAHAFFDSSSPASNAGNWVMDTFNQIGQKTGKKIVITETGWPSGGNGNGAAVASPDAQGTAIGAIQQAFASQANSVYIFQAFDAAYKSPGASGIENKFGIFH